jgi:undecaprenyl-diphosphatase
VTLGVGAVLTLFNRERHLGLAVLAANAASHLAVQVLKRAVHRARPCDVHGIPLALVDLPDPYSFPSGHAAAATAVATSISLAHPAIAPALLPLAILVARSRVTLRVHHPGDVIAGAIVGACGAIAANALL